VNDQGNAGQSLLKRKGGKGVTGLSIVKLEDDQGGGTSPSDHEKAKRTSLVRPLNRALTHKETRTEEEKGRARRWAGDAVAEDRHS